MSNLFKIIKNNFKFYVILAIVIAVGTAGTTFALIFSNFNAINVNTITSTIDANISYDDATNNAEIVNNGNMLPIADDKVDGPDVTDPRVLKVKFNVSGNDTKAGTYEFIDKTAIEIIKRSGIKTVIVNGNNPENVKNAISEPIGTLITN